MATEHDGTAATVAVATAAAGAAAYALKRALAGGKGLPTAAADRDDLGGSNVLSPSSRHWSVPVVLESAPDMLLPLIEHAAEAAGRWVAENSPEVIRDRLLPRFIGSFTDATKRRG